MSSPRTSRTVLDTTRKRWCSASGALAKAEKHNTPPDPSGIAAIASPTWRKCIRIWSQLAAARPLLERAVAIVQATYWPDHPLVATSLSNLALVHRDLDQPAAAHPLLERVLAIDEATYGPDHP